MKTVIIGSGNLATHLSLALKASGMTIAQVYSRTAEHAAELAAKLGCPSTSQVDEVLTDAGLYIISVNDDAISGVAVRLCKARPQAVFLHTAGSVPMNVFRPYGVRHGVLYPMQTFSKNRSVDFRTIPCFIEASDEPTLALDPRNRRAVIRALSALPCAKLIATHDLDFVLDACTRVLLMDGGRIVADGRPDELLRDRTLLERHGLELPLSLSRR